MESGSSYLKHRIQSLQENINSLERKNYQIEQDFDKNNLDVNEYATLETSTLWKKRVFHYILLGTIILLTVWLFRLTIPYDPLSGWTPYILFAVVRFFIVRRRQQKALQFKGHHRSAALLSSLLHSKTDKHDDILSLQREIVLADVQSEAIKNEFKRAKISIDNYATKSVGSLWVRDIVIWIIRLIVTFFYTFTLLIPLFLVVYGAVKNKQAMAQRYRNTQAEILQQSEFIDLIVAHQETIPDLAHHHSIVDVDSLRDVSYIPAQIDDELIQAMLDSEVEVGRMERFVIGKKDQEKVLYKSRINIKPAIEISADDETELGNEVNQDDEIELDDEIDLDDELDDELDGEIDLDNEIDLDDEIDLDYELDDEIDLDEEIESDNKKKRLL